ncbi:hypothetical protein BJY24_000634 [Nocardia transvalensis]|uniref:Uncharacterized protein n=1 Tax=Nocardia transvalensis TaxID=37333 RepID=A0A7W9P935_9NOCA|nr:hypothetical protein [Nocardia transvalensis]MBB5911767.1 hypothetical protein [Nocardia transvalensis]
MLEIAFLVTAVVVLVALVITYRRGRGAGAGPSWNRAEPESGTLYVTGVSPRPAAQGNQYVTITGTITGPSVGGETVYGRFAWDVNQWPSPGDQIPVAYPPGKPQNWQLGHPGARPYFGG